MHRWHALRATDPVIEVRSLDLASPVSYAVVVVLALIDGVIPLVPARTAVIGLGVLAGSGRVAAYPLLAVATAAAFVSDNVSYWLGAHYWPRIQPVLFRGARTRRAWGWVERQLRLHGATLVVLARVLPGGPTPITLSAGSVGLRRRTFRLAALAGAVLWSLYAFSVGLAGDALIGRHPLLALVAALAVAGAINLVLRLLIRRRRDHARPGPPPSAP